MSVFTQMMTLVLISTLQGPVRTGRIIGGHEAKAHSRPYMVILTQLKGGEAFGFCGGFLVNEEFVMTAAHCQAESYTVKLGVHDLRKSNEILELSVAQSFPHEDYNNVTFDNDIMLLKLSEKVRFTRHVECIRLADKRDKKLPKSCSVSGWGSASVKPGPPFFKLMEVNVSLNDALVPTGTHMYCSRERTGPGSGDSGGPLVCEDGRAYGVVSFSRSPCLGDPISCFVKIPDYRTWIDQIIGCK